MNKNFFDFLSEVPYETDRSSSQTTQQGTYGKPLIERMNLRWEHVVKPFLTEITDARVLDLASHDGRWAHAFAAAQARQVVGIEGRSDLVERYSYFPDHEIKQRVELHVGDLFEFTRDLVKRGEEFDVVGVIGIFYHVMDHYGLLSMLRELGPKLIIVDSEFMTQSWPFIALARERTDRDMNSTAYFEDQVVAPVGIPSLQGLELMAETLGYRMETITWDDVPHEARDPVADYFRPGAKRRFTCALRP